MQHPEVGSYEGKPSWFCNDCAARGKGSGHVDHALQVLPSMAWICMTGTVSR